MRKIDSSWGFSIIFERYFFDMFFAYFEKTHIDEGFEENLTFHFIYSNWKVYGDSIFADDFDYFGLIFEFFALILDLGGGGETGGDFWLHGVDDFEV